MRNRMLLLSALALLPACGDDPVSYSAPVGINLKAKSESVANLTVADEKAINTESGNPYGAFVNDARTALGGADPGSIEIDEVTLLLGAGSTGVTTLGEIFAGDVEILFQMNDTDNSFPVSVVGIAADTGPGPVDMHVHFDAGSVQGDDWDKLLGGSFKVVLRGPAATEFAGKGADADLQTTFTFSSYE